MLVNEDPSMRPENYEAMRESAIEKFSKAEAFPATDSGSLEELRREFGQKALYCSLIEVFGRDETVEHLGAFMNERVARLQADILCPRDRSFIIELIDE